MTNSRLLFLLLFLWTLTVPDPVWTAGESTKPLSGKASATEGTTEAETVIGSRGESAEPETKENKGPEIPATFGPLVSDTAIPIGKGKLAVQPTFSYSFVTDRFTGHWRRTEAGGNFQTFGMDWRLTYGPIENMEVFAVVPYVHNWASSVNQPGPGGVTSADAGGLGDVNLALKYRLVEETANRPTVTALFATVFPTGKFKNLNARDLGTDAAGGGSYVFTTGFNISKYIPPVIVYGNLWYSMPTSTTDDGGKQYPGDFVTVNLAAEYPLTGKWVALLELTSTWGRGRLFGPDTNVPREALFSIVPAMEYMATEKFSMALGVKVDLIGKNTDATVGPIFSVIYAF